ncbi:MAG TPA: HlyD family efflux transporter periplasmic adaptor subunit [Bryobacteraceae bacterium]|nr:HlyD family efflux transporter periplasmic adaptor subunit [Bryobacteraceae bacterium]
MDVPRTDARRRKIVRWTIFLGTLALVILGAYLGLSRLKPAAPSVDMSALWPDTAKRGQMVLEVHGLGTLVPEETMLIPATTDGRVSQIFIRPGSPVKADSVVMVLVNPDLETAEQDALFALKAAQADYDNLKVTLQKSLLDMKATAAQVAADYNTAKLEADRDAALAKESLLAGVDAKISAVKAEELGNRNAIEQQRLSINGTAEQSQLAAQQVKIDQLRADYELKKSRVDQLKVRAGFDGMLQQLPDPLKPVEVGQQVTAGTPLGKVAQPSKLKAELKIAETQVKDIAIGLPAVIDTRNGLIDGRVSNIDPSIINGTVTVDVKLEGKLPEAARPDLSVDGTVQIEKLDNVLYVGKPVFGQENATVQIFKMDPDGKYAQKVKVTFGRASVNTIEVKSGLMPGDRVILSDMSQYDAYDRIRLN